MDISENWKKNIGKRFMLSVAVWAALWLCLSEGFYHAAAEAGITVELAASATPSLHGPGAGGSGGGGCFIGSAIE